MQKIISLYQRNYDGDRLVRDEVVPGAEWVLAGEGRATQKIDGTATMVRDGRFFKRYDRKHGKLAPEGWEAAEDAPNENTGHWPGWLPVGDGPEDQWHREAWTDNPGLPDGTYELIGPKVQGNPYGLEKHNLIEHGGADLLPFELTFEGIRVFLATGQAGEGIVWHHPDGRMVKIKARDFGLPWPPR